MAIEATRQKPSKGVAATVKDCPPAAAAHLRDIRAMIYDIAAARADIGQITETLKWGQPAYLTEKPRSGTTIRLGWDESGETVSVFVHCQTSLVESWRARYDDTLTFVGNREIRLLTAAPLPRKPLAHCIAMALTYHSRKKES